MGQDGNNLSLLMITTTWLKSLIHVKPKCLQCFKKQTKLSPIPIESSQQGWNLHWGFHAKPLYEDNMIKTLYAYIYKAKNIWWVDIDEIIFHLHL